jgi:putative redox protein
MIDSESERPNQFAQVLHIGPHTLRADASPSEGGEGSGPSAHDLFDASLAACKGLTAVWYARRHNIPLERVETHVERDDTDERKGTYRLKVRLAFHGPLDDEQRRKLHDVASRCPVQKLMTTSTVEIETL